MTEGDLSGPRFSHSPAREMPGLVAALDWAATPLGARSTWSSSLSMAVDIVLASGFPMALRWGPQFVLIYNDGYRPILGDKHPLALGRPASDVWSEVWPQIAPFHHQIFSGESDAVFAQDLLLRIQRHGELWEDARFTLSYSPTPDPTAASGIGGIFVTAIETTDRVEAEQRHLVERRRQQQLLSQMPGFVGILSGPDHVYDYVNEAYIAISGPRAFLGRTVREVFPELAGQGFYELLDQVYATGERYVARGLPLRLAGESEDRFIDLLYEAIRNDFGEVTGVFVGGYDVTETHRSAAALRDLNVELERRVIERSRERGLVWQLSPDLLGALSSEGYFLSSNPAWKTVLGWSEAEVASQSIFELLHPDDVARTREGFELTQRGQPAIRFPNRYRCKNGSYRWISWVGIPEDGVVYCSGRDITEEVAAQDALAGANEALRQAQKMEAVGQLTGGIAHDFNNLLAGIGGSLELLEKRLAEGRPDGVARYIGIAQASTRRAAALTQRLLAFSRRQTLDPKPTDVNRLVAGMDDLIRRTVGPAVEVEAVGAGGLWLTKIDPSQLESALLNLVINARDAMPDGGRITIETANKWLDARAARERDLPAGQYISLCVTDTGAGMTPDVIERAFDPFFTTKPLGEGTGLGLSMVHGFARQSGGQVRIYSELEKGTTLCLYLPRFAGALEPEPSEEDAGGSAAPHGETVLVIDDEDSVRMLVSDVLREAGYRVLLAPNGPAGLKILDAEPRIDLLVTDVGLPGGLNGRQVADAARTTRPDLKVLFITGYAENAAIGNGLLGAGMSVIGKPFSMASLAGRVREIIDSEPAPRTSPAT
jgi:PAS domain S-box-containing protein